MKAQTDISQSWINSQESACVEQEELERWNKEEYWAKEEVLCKLNTTQRTEYIELHTTHKCMYKYIAVALAIQIMRGRIKAVVIRQVDRVIHIKIGETDKDVDFSSKKTIVPPERKSSTKILATITMMKGSERKGHTHKINTKYSLTLISQCILMILSEKDN